VPRPENKIDLPWRKRRTLFEAKAERGFIAQFVKPLVVPVVLAVLAFYTGQVSERDKQRGQDDRQSVASRRQLFVATAQDFSVYITHWERLSSIAKTEEEMLTLVQQEERELRALRNGGRRSKEEAMRRQSILDKFKEELKSVGARKERYVTSRDAAKDRLFGSFEQTYLFFGNEAASAVKDFVEFDSQKMGKSNSDLPSFEQLRKLGRSIFESMRKDIQNDEQKLKTQ
jgi:hypothetical protein